MFIEAIFALLMIPFILLFVLAFPIVIGVVVYRDANKRVDASPWLWALVAALAPSFIGVIVYLIVRNDYPLKSTYNQSRQSGEFDSADESSYYQQEYDNQAVEPKKGFPTWAKVLLIIAAVVIGLLILTGFIGLIKYIFGFNSFSGFGHQYYGF